MSSRIFTVPETLDWKQAYMAAILERDPVSVLDLIQQAREKLSTRLRKLTAIGSIHCDEIEAIHDAFYLLQALQSSLSYRDEAASWRDDRERVA